MTRRRYPYIPPRDVVARVQSVSVQTSRVRAASESAVRSEETALIRDPDSGIEAINWKLQQVNDRLEAIENPPE